MRKEDGKQRREDQTDRRNCRNKRKRERDRVILGERDRTDSCMMGCNEHEQLPNLLSQTHYQDDQRSD